MCLRYSFPPHAERRGEGARQCQYRCQQETAASAHEQGCLQHRGNTREWLLLAHLYRRRSDFPMRCRMHLMIPFLSIPVCIQHTNEAPLTHYGKSLSSFLS